MIKTKDAHKMRCCGPEGCGDSKPSRTPSIADAGNPQLRFCIGARCMAWRDEFPGEGATFGDPRGYCGLVGEVAP